MDIDISNWECSPPQKHLEAFLHPFLPKALAETLHLSSLSISYWLLLLLETLMRAHQQLLVTMISFFFYFVSCIKIKIQSVAVISKLTCDAAT